MLIELPSREDGKIAVFGMNKNKDVAPKFLFLNFLGYCWQCWDLILH
jgi:hypothetical protein